MSRTLLIRFDCPTGGVALFLNGFMLIGPDETGRANSQAAPFLRTGENLFEMVPERADVTASLSVVDLSQGDPQTAPALVQMEVASAMPVTEVLSLDAAQPEFGWHRAEVIEDISARREPLYGAAETFAGLLERGPDEDLLAVLEMKHAEMALSVGLARDEMDDGLLEGLAGLRAAPGFRVELAPRDDFLPLLSSNGRIVNLRRASGGDAIRIMDGISNPGFSVAIARIDDRWHIVR